jgi:signal transduction histidine kinase
MRKSAELQNLVLSAISAGTWDLNFETTTVSHNEVFSKILGVADGLLDHQYPIKTFSIHPDDIDGVLEDGTMIWAEGLGRVIERDAQGQPRRMVGVLRDVTDEVETKRRLFETESNFSDGVDSVPGAIIRCRRSSDGLPELKYVSQKIWEIWDLSPGEITARPELIWDTVDGSDSAMVQSAFTLSGPGLEPIDIKANITAGGERRKRTHILAAPPNLTQIPATRTFLVLGITDQARIESELQKSREIILQAQKMEAIGNLSGGMAHDFNNLLAVVLVNLELLRVSSRQ